MKILIETKTKVNYKLRLNNDNINSYTVRVDNIFESSGIVLNKYSTIISQIFLNNGLFINTIFSFLLKLKKDGNSLYYKELHDKLLIRTKIIMREQKLLLILYKPKKELINYLDVEYINYKSVNTVDELIKTIKLYL